MWELVVFLYRLSISSREGDDDEGVPSENEEDRRLQEIKVKELRGTEFRLSFSGLKWLNFFVYGLFGFREKVNTENKVLRTLHTESEIIVRNFRTLKNKYDLMLRQPRLHTASETFVCH